MAERPLIQRPTLAAGPTPARSPAVPHPAAPLTPEQVREHEQGNTVLGMWVFLMTELMLFGGLFLGYAAYRYVYAAGFAEASRHLNAPLGAINTAILIGSSLMVALGVRAAQTGGRRSVVVFFALTLALGLAFLAIKGSEYWAEYQEALIPGLNFTFAPEHARAAQLFFVLYFLMTGLHAVHMLVGLGLVSYVTVQAGRGRYSPEHYATVDVVGLYWHFVDVIWVFLFPLLYLIERH